MKFIENIISSICSTVLGVCEFLFGDFVTEVAELGDPSALFDSIFPGAAGFDDAIYTIAIALGILYAMYSLITTMTTSDTKAAEAPLSVLLRMMIFLPLTIWSREICKVFYDLQTTLTTFMMQNYNPPDNGGFFDAIVDDLTSGKNLWSTAAGDTLKVSFAANGGAVIGLLIAVIFVVLLFIDTMKLIMNIIEQYVLIGILTHLSPLALSTGCTRKTNQILSSWFNLLCTHLLIFMLDQWSLSVFRNACTSLRADGGKFGIITWIVALDAFLRLSAHWETILGKLGLRAVGAGQGRMASILAAAAVGRGMARIGSQGLKTAVHMSNGTYQPRPGSLAEAFASGAKKNVERDPIGYATNGTPKGFYGKQAQKAANDGIAAAKKDFMAGNEKRSFPMSPVDSTRAHNNAYNKQWSDMVNQQKEAGSAKALKDVAAGQKQTFNPPTNERDRAFQDGYNSSYNRAYSDLMNQQRTAGAAAAMTDMQAGRKAQAFNAPTTDAERAYQDAYRQGVANWNTAHPNPGARPTPSGGEPGMIAAVRNTAMKDGNLRASGVRDVGAPVLTQPASQMKYDSAGRSYGGETSQDANSIRTAIGLTGVMNGENATFSSIGNGGAEQMRIREGSAVSWDAPGRGTMNACVEMIGANGTLGVSEKSGEIKFVPDNEENRKMAEVSGSQAFSVSIPGEDGKSENFLAFYNGDLLATNSRGEVLTNAFGEDISYNVKAPVEIVGGPMDSTPAADTIAESLNDTTVPEGSSAPEHVLTTTLNTVQQQSVQVITQAPRSGDSGSVIEELLPDDEGDATDATEEEIFGGSENQETPKTDIPYYDEGGDPDKFEQDGNPFDDYLQGSD